MAKLNLVMVDGAPLELATERASRLKDGPKTPVDPYTQTVLFLRGVKSRSWIALAHLYLSIGAKGAREQEALSYPVKTLAYALDFSATTTVSLCCRKVFDHDTREMSGRRLVKLSTDDAEKVAAYWAKNAKRDIADARATVSLLQAIFSPLCLHKKQLRDSKLLLARRVGYLKRHADGEAAHLSLDYYEFDGRDAGHVVAALAIIGTLIEEFDGPSAVSLDEFDEAAYAAAKSVFPSLDCKRLFGRKSMASVVEQYRQVAPSDAVHHLSERLPLDLRWF